ncbi:MAG: acyl carrier protein [Alphaproteobacteria bacterium]
MTDVGRIEADLRRTVAEILEMEPEAVTDETGAATVEAWDSLNHIRIVLAIEDAHGIRFPVARIERMTSFRSLVDATLEALAGR